MIVLDTNVVSQLMRKRPDPTVLAWIRKQSGVQLHLTALTVAEIHRGLILLPEGRRKAGLVNAFDAFLARGFHQRILPFTRETALAYAPIYQSRVQAGLGVGELDLLIAAIARQHDARLATRNTADFEGCGLRLINPWLD